MGTIIFGSDHAGYDLKEKLKAYLKGKGYSIEDEGTYSADSVDYPDYAFKVAKKIRPRKFGILICGSGVGVSIAANRIKGVRAALAYDEKVARLSRLHNDANVLCLPGRMLPFQKIRKIVDTFLNTGFTNEERHIRRVKKLG